MRKASCTGQSHAGGLFGADKKVEDSDDGKGMVIKMGAQQETAENTVETKNDSMRQEYTFAPDVKLKECKYCRVMIPDKARICPNCKTTLKGNIWGKIAAMLAAVFVGGACYCFLAYQGILPAFAVPSWLAQKKPAEAVAAVTLVETPEIAAGAKPVEPTEVAAETGKGATKEGSVDTDTAAVVQAAEDAWAPSGEKKPEQKEQDNSGREAAKPTEETDKETDTNSGTTDRDENETKSGTADKDGNGTKSGTADKDEDDTKSETADKDGNDTKSGVSDIDEEEEKSGASDKEAAGAKSREADEDDTDAKTDAADIDKDDAAARTDTTDKEADVKGETDEAAFRTACEPVAYKALLREQEEYLDEAIMLEVQVVCQVEGGLFDDNTYYLCVAEEKNNIERYYIIRDNRESDETFILEGDILTVYGQLFGNCKLPANLIDTRPTVPAVSMLYCDLSEE